ncbi:MAG TPA: thioredoxin family protein [Pyrinomonadaceae bacterium]|jgi:peroxiredoxin
MKKFYAGALVAALTLVLTAGATASGLGDGAGGAIGEKVADFKLPDAKGAERTLASLRGKNGTVLIFVSVQCPVSNAYNERMEKLAQEYKARGINVVGINSNATETTEAVAEHALEKGLSFPILKDNGNKIADRLGALVTPEAYLLDASGKLVYRGRIDNSRNGDSITSSELRESIDALLAGKPIAKSEARAFGCSIKRAS